MQQPIKAILFDMGGTLRFSTQQDAKVKTEKVTKIQEMIGASGPPEMFIETLSGRMKAYKSWRAETLIELDEAKLWTEWLLPDYPVEQIQPLAMQLNLIWRNTLSSWQILPEACEVVAELFRRGYRLGLVSNTTSSVEAHRVLKELHLSGYFDTVVLSSVHGKRKPDPSILLAATKKMRIAAEQCTYVGDRNDRDVAGSRQAGFAQVIILNDPHVVAAEEQDPAFPPDRTITNLKELLDIFPPLEPLSRHPYSVSPISGQAKDRPTFDASLSTMWCIRTSLRLEDGLQAARRMGFASVELNHQVNSEILKGIDFQDYSVRSVHEPCPADISTDVLSIHDWLISATDETCRQQGVLAIKRSIELARDLGAGTMVVHCGDVRGGLPAKATLAGLYHSRDTHPDAFLDMRARLIRLRAEQAPARIEAVMKSLSELLDYAGRYGIRLGLENRYHYGDIPIPDEMERLLSLADPDQLGFIYDTGHGQALENLGFFAHTEWLNRFSSRIIGVHLHDIRGITDHLSPGLGEIDFLEIAAVVPEQAFRTVELRVDQTPMQIVAGMETLVEKGCVQCL